MIFGDVNNKQSQCNWNDWWVEKISSVQYCVFVSNLLVPVNFSQ